MSKYQSNYVLTYLLTYLFIYLPTYDIIGYTACHFVILWQNIPVFQYTVKSVVLDLSNPTTLKKLLTSIATSR